ncbi:hypothetical protein BaRGS_00003260 [Batillaria attramentaria]|uniref:Uncharacterized protein n=1 Tax=Batillaria attramentaria TaxID=370345 RepID=A0ABD0M1U6_9CAEN
MSVTVRDPLVRQFDQLPYSCKVISTKSATQTASHKERLVSQTKLQEMEGSRVQRGMAGLIKEKLPPKRLESESVNNCKASVGRQKSIELIISLPPGLTTLVSMQINPRDLFTPTNQYPFLATS